MKKVNAFWAWFFCSLYRVSRPHLGGDDVLVNDESGLLGPETKGGMMTIAPAEAEPIAEVQVVAIKNDGTK